MDYSADIASAYQMITDYGGLVTVYQKTVYHYDAVSDDEVSTTSTASAYGVFLDYQTADIDGTEIKRGDMRLLIAGYSLSTELNKTTDYIVDASGTRWRIVNFDKVAPNGSDVILYKLQVRQS
jgi:hypothetical protein